MDFDISKISCACRKGDRALVEQHWPDAYDELRRIARHHLRSSLRNATLDTSALLHDTYLKLEISPSKTPDRGQFLAVCSTVMRCLVIDEIRRKASLKRGGDLHRTTLSTKTPAIEGAAAIDALDLESALETLGDVAPRLVHLVEMKFYGGLSNEEIAEAIGISIATVKRDWLKARTLLRGLLAAAESESE